jgi:cell division septation protein DedD
MLPSAAPPVAAPPVHVVHSMAAPNNISGLSPNVNVTSAPMLVTGQTMSAPTPGGGWHTLQVTDMPVRDVLDALAKDANMSVRLAPDVDGQVTLSEHNQPLDKILERIAQQTAVKYDRVGNSLFVSRQSGATTPQAASLDQAMHNYRAVEQQLAAGPTSQPVPQAMGQSVPRTPALSSAALRPARVENVSAHSGSRRSMLDDVPDKPDALDAFQSGNNTYLDFTSASNGDDDEGSGVAQVALEGSGKAAREEEEEADDEESPEERQMAKAEEKTADPPLNGLSSDAPRPAAVVARRPAAATAAVGINQEGIVSQQGASVVLIKHKQPFGKATVSDPKTTTPEPADKATPISAMEKYYVNLGSFLPKQEAQERFELATQTGLPLFLETVEIDSQIYQRVRSGPFSSQEGAQHAQEKLVSRSGSQAFISDY